MEYWVRVLTGIVAMACFYLIGPVLYSCVKDVRMLMKRLSHSEKDIRSLETRVSLLEYHKLDKGTMMKGKAGDLARQK